MRQNDALQSTLFSLGDSGRLRHSLAKVGSSSLSSVEVPPASTRVFFIPARARSPGLVAEPQSGEFFPESQGQSSSGGRSWCVVGAPKYSSSQSKAGRAVLECADGHSAMPTSRVVHCKRQRRRSAYVPQAHLMAPGFGHPRGAQGGRATHGHRP